MHMGAGSGTKRASLFCIQWECVADVNLNCRPTARRLGGSKGVLGARKPDDDDDHDEGDDKQAERCGQRGHVGRPQ